MEAIGCCVHSSSMRIFGQATLVETYLGHLLYFLLLRGEFHQKVPAIDIWKIHENSCDLWKAMFCFMMFNQVLVAMMTNHVKASNIPGFIQLIDSAPSISHQLGSGEHVDTDVAQHEAASKAEHVQGDASDFFILNISQPLLQK